MTQDELLTIAIEHMRWLNSEKAEGARADFRGLDLRGLNLSGLMLARAKFKKASLAGAICKGTCFARADLRNADMSRAIVYGANFMEADITEMAFNLAKTHRQEKVIFSKRHEHHLALSKGWDKKGVFFK